MNEEVKSPLQVDKQPIVYDENNECLLCKIPIGKDDQECLMFTLSETKIKRLCHLICIIEAMEYLRSHRSQQIGSCSGHHE